VIQDDLEQLKQRMPLLDYLERHNWAGRPAGSQQEFVGLCPLHRESRPSFYVNIHKNLFYCHGCGCGGDLIRFAELYFRLSFPRAVTHLKQELESPTEWEVFNQAETFYRSQLQGNRVALDYLQQRGVRDTELIRQLGMGYAPGGNLRRHLNTLGYSSGLLLETGLINPLGLDVFWQRVVFSCRHAGQVINFYGRGIHPALPQHRFLPRPKGDLLGWELVRDFSELILVEGPFDVAVLWQAGFRNSTCAFGTHLTPAQIMQLSDCRERQVLLAFDSDANSAGLQAAHRLARRLQCTGLRARIVQLPPGHDPNSYFTAGATGNDFAQLLQQANSPWL